MSTIVVGHDGSETSTYAVLEAAHLAEATKSTLHIVSAFKSGSAKVEVEGRSFGIGGLEHAEQVADDAASRVRSRVDVTTAATQGDPATVLTAEAERLDADMIVVGNARTHGISRILGSVASDVIRRAPCSVYVSHSTG